MDTSSRFNPIQNHLLDRVSAVDYQYLQPHFELVALPPGHSINEVGSRIGYFYFPVNCIVTLLNTTQSGTSMEIAMMGRDGLTGISRFLGSETAIWRAITVSAGYAYRINAAVLMQRFEGSETLRHVLLRYTHSLITQIAQTITCNRLHLVDQRLCRWLLMSLDLLEANELHMTQELIAHMIGVRRTGVTEAAGLLQSAGLIHYSRGCITVLDRPRLEARVCECYATVKRETERLFPSKPATS